MLHLAVIWIVTAMLASTAVFGFAWAIRNRQFQDTDASARSIFGPDELPTDV